jgi:hypothetical protein
MTKVEAIEKVRKLLALANSANENEAAAAAGRAADIMERHRLDAAMVAEAEQCEIERDEPLDLNREIKSERLHARTPTWYWTLAWGVADANRCKPHHVYAGEGRYAVCFIGKPSDASAARYMLDALANEVDRLAVAYVARVAGRASRSAGKSFRLGAAAKIDARLRASMRETTEAVRGELAAAHDERGLARLDIAIARRETDGKRLDAFLGANGIKYGAARSASVSNADAFRAGAKAGDGVRLSGGTAALGHGARALKAG